MAGCNKCGGVIDVYCLFKGECIHNTKKLILEGNSFNIDRSVNQKPNTEKIKEPMYKVPIKRPNTIKVEFNNCWLKKNSGDQFIFHLLMFRCSRKYKVAELIILNFSIMIYKK